MPHPRPQDPDRSLPRKVVDRIDEALHPLRRRLAVARLRALPPNPRILFICQGNICRSPYAEHSYRRLAGIEGDDRDRIFSAGFVQPGRPSPEEAKRVAGERGIDLGGHISAPIVLDRVRTTDLVVVMEPRQRRQFRELHGRGAWSILILGDLDPEPIVWRRIRDPFDHDDAFFLDVYRRIDRCLGTLAAAIGVRVPSRRAAQRDPGAR